jgi:hypothetical protein
MSWKRTQTHFFSFQLDIEAQGERNTEEEERKHSHEIIRASTCCQEVVDRFQIALEGLKGKSHEAKPEKTTKK